MYIMFRMWVYLQDKFAEVGWLGQKGRNICDVDRQCRIAPTGNNNWPAHLQYMDLCLHSFSVKTLGMHILTFHCKSFLFHFKVY